MTHNNKQEWKPTDEEELVCRRFVEKSVETAVENNLSLMNLLRMKYCVVVEGLPKVLFCNDDGLTRIKLDDETKKSLRNTNKNTISYVVVINKRETISFCAEKKSIAQLYCYLIKSK